MLSSMGCPIRIFDESDCGTKRARPEHGKVSWPDQAIPEGIPTLPRSGRRHGSKHAGFSAPVARFDIDIDCTAETEKLRRRGATGKRGRNINAPKSHWIP